MIRRHIVVGASTIIPGGPVDLILLPGEETPELHDNVRVFKPKSLDHALHLMRENYAEHAAIATLGSTEVVGAPDEWRDAIEARLASFIDDLGNSAVDSWIGALHALRNGKSMAMRPWNQDLSDVFSAQEPSPPAICIAAGPSAHEFLDEVRNLRPWVVIFAADSMLSGLLDAGIDPDFVTFAERAPEVSSYAARAKESRATIIATPVVDPGIVSAFGGRVIWWNQDDDLTRFMAPDTIPDFCGRSAGTMTIAAAIAAGLTRIYLVGHDLCYGPDGSSHSKAAHPVAAKSQASEDARGSVVHLQTMGNHGLPVETNAWWNAFRVDIEFMLTSTQATVINVCNYTGAWIAGTKVGQLPSTLRRIENVNQPKRGGYRATIPPVERIRANCLHISRRADEISDDMQRGLLKPHFAAAMLAIGALVPSDCAWLFRYVFRSVYHSLLLRMHMGADQQTCIRILALTLRAMSERMIAELDEAA